MKLLLDTHVLLWAIEGNKRLGPGARAAIVDRRNDVLFSIVSIWELLIKIRVGKLHLDWRKLSAIASETGFRRIGVDMAHLETLSLLPRHHGDPYDHLLLAQASVEEATLVTSDQHMTRYGITCMDCR